MREHHTAPPPRTRAEVEAVFRERPESTWHAKSDDAPDDVKILFVAGPKDHGSGEHDYPWFQQSWADLLATLPGVTTIRADGWPARADWEAADLAVCYFWCHDWDDRRYADLDCFLGRGGGLVCLHAAIIEDDRPQKLARHIGLAGQRPSMQYRHGPIDLRFDGHAGHPITRGFNRLSLVDESYWVFSGDVARVNVLATSTEQEAARPQLWTYEPEAGRVFSNALGHFRWTFDDPLFRILLLRGMAWAARQETDRFSRLATQGVELRDA